MTTPHPHPTYIPNATLDSLHDIMTPLSEPHHYSPSTPSSKPSQPTTVRLVTNPASYIKGALAGWLAAWSCVIALAVCSLYGPALTVRIDTPVARPPGQSPPARPPALMITSTPDDLT